MGSLKRRRSSAGMPTVRMSAEPPVYTLNEERTPLSRRVKGLIALNILGVLLVVAVGLWLLLRPTAATPVAPAAPASAQPNAAQPAPAANVQLPVQLAGINPQECVAVSGLPIVADAVCIEHDTDRDDGVLKQDNTYVVAATADDVRRFFEQALAENGWTITDSSHDAEDGAWDYKAVQGQRQLKVEVDTQQAPNGTFAEFRIAED